MRKMKKALALTLASTMALSMAACGSEDTATENTDSAEVEGTTEVEEESGADTFNIGGVGPTTGGAAVYGLAVQYGAQIAVDEINAAGGINGYEIAFNFQDDEHDAEKSVNAYNALKDWGMDVLMGAVTSAPSTAVAAEAAADGMYMLTPSASSTAVTEGKTNVFQVCFSDPNQGTGAAQYIGDNELATKVAVIYDSSDVYSTGIFEKFYAEAANQEFEIVAAEAFTADSNTDFSVQLQKAKDSEAELIFLPIYAQEAALLLAQASTAGVDATFFGCDGLDGILSIEGFDTTLAEGVILLTPFVADAEEAATQAFVATYEAAHGEVPNQFAADAYDAIYIIKEAMESTGVTPDMTAEDISAALISAMETISFDGLTGDGMTWTATGEVAKDPKAVVIQDGVYVGAN